jgi:hypothetical protein
MAPLFNWDDEEIDLSTPIGSARIACEVISNDSDNTPKLPVRTIGGKRYLEIDQSANRRAGSKISLIWQHGLEIWAMDSPNLDKYWLCSLCVTKTTLMKITSIPILRTKKTRANQSMHSRHGGTACATRTDPSVTNSVAIVPGAQALPQRIQHPESHSLVGRSRAAIPQHSPVGI